MGFWDKLRGQFIDVIEWLDPTQETMVYRFPRGDNEIKNGAQLIVRESQTAVFIHEGELGDVFGPGRVKLTTANIPVLTTLASWKYAFDAPFKCEIYFINTKHFTDLKWGTQNPVMLRDKEFGPIRLRAFGSYCIRCADPAKFIRHIVGTDHVFETSEITGQLRNMLLTRFADTLAESGIPALDLAANYNELSDTLSHELQKDFAEYGLELTKFLIENVSLPEEVEKALDQRARMGIIDDMGKYTRLKTADAIGDMANNPGGSGGMMGMIAGLGAGGIVSGAMQAGAAQVNPQKGPPPIPEGTSFYAAIDGKQAGPFTMPELARRIGSGEVGADTLVWKQGMEQWTPASEVSELTGLLGASGPPPLPGQSGDDR